MCPYDCARLGVVQLGTSLRSHRDATYRGTHLDLFSSSPPIALKSSSTGPTAEEVQAWRIHFKWMKQFACTAVFTIPHLMLPYPTGPTGPRRMPILTITALLPFYCSMIMLAYYMPALRDRSTLGSRGIEPLKRDIASFERSRKPRARAVSMPPSCAYRSSSPSYQARHSHILCLSICKWYSQRRRSVRALR
ncbi:hypothetical protein PENSPDRAFT_650395 [Peniophora sp. CONT]|nr:hypothetical protein PENSPDRAFT_650395 [Peniophora sp. CONT]